MRHLRLTLFTSLLFSQVVLGAAAQIANDARFDALMENLEAMRIENQVAGLGLVIADDSGIRHLATRGVVDRSTGAALRTDAIFRIGSITKMFTGLAALQLAAATDFDIDSPINRWPMTDYYTNPWADSDRITTAMLLEHTAGLTDLIKAEWDYSDPQQLPLDTTLRLYPEARRLQWRPGVHSSYSNAGAGLAGRVMELVAKEPYEALMERLVFEPLALSQTTVLPPREGLPVGYDRDGVTPIPYWHQIFRPFAAINSNLADMGRFTTLLLNRGAQGEAQLIDAKLIDRLETPHTSLAARSGLRYGYGLGNYTWLRDGILFHGHGGDADGYLSRMGYTRANHSGYFLVITAFQNRTLRAMQGAIETYLTEGVVTPEAPRAAALNGEEISERVGRYKEATKRFPGAKRSTMTITRRNNKLFTQVADGRSRELIPVTGSHFRRRHQNRATIFLGPDSRGRMVYQGNARNFEIVVDPDTRHPARQVEDLR